MDRDKIKEIQTRVCIDLFKDWCNEFKCHQPAFQVITKQMMGFDYDGLTETEKYVAGVLLTFLSFVKKNKLSHSLFKDEIEEFLYQNLKDGDRCRKSEAILFKK